MKNKLGIFILLIIMVFGLLSCFEKQDSVVISKEFMGEQWGRFDYLETDYHVVKAPMTADLVMELIVSDAYPNIYPYHGDDDGVFVVTMSINAPDGSKRSREFSYRLKDRDGVFKSEKTEGYYHFELPLINEMSFSEKGEYHFKIENKYSKDPLYGVKSLRIKNINK